MVGSLVCRFKLYSALLLLFNADGASGSSVQHTTMWDNIYTPTFENHTEGQLAQTITVGQTANLACTVRNLGDRAVSWIRKHDLHIITIGIMTYTNDQRFQAVHTEDSDAWTLRIVSGQQRDSATYECQVSTEPKISLGFKLTVVVAKARIFSNTHMYYKSGSEINLTCASEIVSHAPSFIYWYKDGHLINYSQRGGINVLTEQKTARSMLLISRAAPSDSGNYTCLPSNANSASVVVHVIKTENQAKIRQHQNKAGLAVRPQNSLFTTAASLLTLIFGINSSGGLSTSMPLIFYIFGSSNGRFNRCASVIMPNNKWHLL